MIIIIHGDDTASSRKYYIELKKKHPHVFELEGEKVTLTDLYQIFEGGELFQTSKIIFIEQLLSKKKKGKERDQIIEYLQKNTGEHSIHLWENKDLGKDVAKTFKQAEIKTFKLPQTMFLFLDSIAPGNSKKLLSLFHQTIQETEIEMVFFMLVRQFRLLLAIRKTENEQQIDEIKRIAPWQKSKLEKQSSLFDKQKLIELYRKLFDIEAAQKTGTLTTSLTIAIDFFLLEL